MDEPRIRITICIPLNDNTVNHVNDFVSMLTLKFQGATYSSPELKPFLGKWLDNPAEDLMLIFVDASLPISQNSKIKSGPYQSAFLPWANRIPG